MLCPLCVSDLRDIISFPAMYKLSDLPLLKRAHIISFSEITCARYPLSFPAGGMGGDRR